MNRMTPHTFKPGEAVFHLDSSIRRTQPFTPVRAVVLESNLWKPRIYRAGAQRPSTVHQGYLAYQGYCAACLTPAHAREGALYCPGCNGDIIATPLPDDMLFRRYGELDLRYQMTAYRAVLHPDWTWSQAWHDANQQLDAIYELYPAKLAALGLPEIDPWSNYQSGDAASHTRLLYLAYIGDDAAFLETYRAWEQRRKPFDLEGFYEAQERHYLNLAPKWQPPADDQTPDTPDDFGDWLERKMAA